MHQRESQRWARVARHYLLLSPDDRKRSSEGARKRRPRKAVSAREGGASAVELVAVGREQEASPEALPSVALVPEVANTDLADSVVELEPEVVEHPAARVVETEAEVVEVAASSTELSPVTPSLPTIPLDRLTAGELFALIPFEEATTGAQGLLPLEPPPPVSTGLHLSAADFFGSVVPWEGQENSLSPRSELGRLMAVATRDAIGRAHRFAQPSRPDVSSAGQFFQNLNWLGAHTYAS